MIFPKPKDFWLNDIDVHRVHGIQEVSAIIFGMKFINQSTLFSLSESILSEIFLVDSNLDSSKIFPILADLLNFLFFYLTTWNVEVHHCIELNLLPHNYLDFILVVNCGKVW